MARNLGHRLLADVEHGPQRQGHRAPPRMPHGQRERDPDVAVEILLVGRTGRGIVMDVGPFDLRPVTLGRRVVDDRQQPIGQRQGPQHQNQQPRGDRFALASEAGQEVIIVREVGADAGGSQPRRDGATPVGKEDPAQQHRQPPAIPGMQSGRQPLAPLRPFLRTLPTNLVSPSLALPSCGLFSNRSMMEEPFSLNVNC